MVSNCEGALAAKLIIFLLVAVLSALNLGNSDLWFDSEKIADGQLWRLITCHLVHTNFNHMILNLCFFAILIWVMEPLVLLKFAAGTSILIGLGLWLILEPQYTYGGLSGISYGFAIVALWLRRRQSQFSHLYVLGILLLLAKLVLDFYSFPSPAFSNSDSILIPHAHFLGALSALILIAATTRFFGIIGVLFFMIWSTAPSQAMAVEPGATSVNSSGQIPWIDYRRLSFHGGLGFVRGSVTQSDVEKGLDEAGIILDEFSLNINRPGYQLGLAYEINDNLHLEFMYFNFGRVEVYASGTGITEDQLADAFRYRLPGTGAGPFASVKINKWVVNPFHRIFARAGFFHANSGYDVTGNVAINRSENSIIIGGGYEYFYRKQMSVRGELNYSKLHDENVFYLGPTLVVYLDGVPREQVKVTKPEEIRPLAPPESLKVTIYFDFDKFNVRPSEQSKINQIKEFLANHPSAVVILSGHTDSYGDKGYNIRLSQDRIESVKKALIKDMIPGERIRTSIHGEDVAADSNGTQQGRQGNRRVNACVVDPSLEADEVCLGLDVEKIPPTGK